MRLAWWSGVIGPVSAAVLLSGPSSAVDLPPSFFDKDRLQIKYSNSAPVAGSSGTMFADIQSAEAEEALESAPVKRKSPFKAFALSALLPGAGQFYNGSKIKPILFLGAEAAAWGFNLKFHNDGDEATDAYEAYNDAHWSENDYEQYLWLGYRETDDEAVDAREVSHHLPDTKTQQYYEMTGKYNQFAWGWDDAALNGNNLEYYVGLDTIPPITGDPTTPSSARRMIYEGMRDDANSKYDRADKMIIFAIVNRLVSGFEAFFSARKINEKLGVSGSTFSRIDVDVSLKSYHSRRDTPYMKLTYKF